jgi:hypothetical protein
MNTFGKAFAYAMAVTLLAYTWVDLVPAGFMATWTNPSHFATLGGVVSVPVFMITAIWPPKDPRFERSFLAQVLASMPMFYLWAAIRSGTSFDIAVEVLGLVFFVGLAVYGYFKSPMLIGAGILAHGLLWDSWHHQHTAIMETWYPMACLIFDVAAGMLVMAHFYRAGEPEVNAPGVAT